MHATTSLDMQFGGNRGKWRNVIKDIATFWARISIAEASTLSGGKSEIIVFMLSIQNTLKQLWHARWSSNMQYEVNWTKWGNVIKHLGDSVVGNFRGPSSAMGRS